MGLTENLNDLYGTLMGLLENRKLLLPSCFPEDISILLDGLFNGYLLMKVSNEIWGSGEID